MKSQIMDMATALEMDILISQMARFFSEIEHAFTKHRISLKYEQTSKHANQEIRTALVHLNDRVVHLQGAEALAVQSYCINLSKVFYNLLRLSHKVETKVQSKILFSNQAAHEVSVIMQRTHALLPHVIDSLRVRNKLIISHIEKEANALTELAVKAATQHEDRLREGTCHPKAATIFMEMLEQLKDILWHFKALTSENGMAEIEKA